MAVPLEQFGAHAALRGWQTTAAARIAAFKAAYCTSLNPKTEADARIVSAQLATIGDSTRYHGLLLPLIAMLIAINFIDVVPLWRVGGWWLAVMLLFGGAALANRYRPPPKSSVSPRDATEAAKVFTLASSVLTIVWCAIVPALWIPGDTLNHIVLVLIIASSMASCSSVNAPHFASGRICMTIYGLTLTLTPLFLEPTPNIFFILMALAFWISMAFQLHSNHDMTKRMLSLQDERTGLIEDLVRAKDESDRARDHAEQASHAKSQFLANMSHELRTPLNAILGFSEMIQTGIGMSEPGRHCEYAKFVHDSGQHLLALINDVLDLAKIESGGMALRESEVPLERTIADFVELMKQKATADGVALSCDVAAGLPAVFADARALRQVMLNLLSNALKFTPSGGTVTAFAYTQPNGAIAFGVRDTGTGIAQADLDYVFEKFGQGRHDIAMTEKGTGLGLAIVRGLMRAHGGDVTLTSRIGEGTCVSAWLPRERACSTLSLQASA